jgi:hypothetical protein
MPKDLKCVYDNEGFAYNYLKRRYYVQNGWYWQAVKEWAKKEGLEKYTVMPMQFIVCDTSINQRRPLLFDTTEEHITEAFSGFTNNGRHYKGIFQLIDEITWANDTQIWNITKENYDNKNIITLPIFDDK